MTLTARDVRAAHEQLGRADEIVHQRRVLYLAAVDLCGGPDERRIEDDVLDNPAVRGQLGAVLGGRAPGASVRLRPLMDLVAPGFATEVDGRAVRLASAPSVLAGALDRVAGELQRHGDEKSALGLLTTGERARLDDAYGRLVEGVRLAVEVAPELATDLIPHVDLFGVVVAAECARLGSASAREYPGLILIPEPDSVLEVAEALIHEGAHQKFFDFGMTRDMLGTRSPRAPRFAPSWAPAGAPEWPLEQSLAAWHAYHCLAVFHRCLADSAESPRQHSDSLLPKAAERATEIGRWLLGRGSFLGADAHTLIGLLEGARPHDPWPANDVDLAVVRDIDDESVVLRRAGNRTLVVRRGEPAELFWVQSALVPG